MDTLYLLLFRDDLQLLDQGALSVTNPQSSTIHRRHYKDKGKMIWSLVTFSLIPALSAMSAGDNMLLGGLQSLPNMASMGSLPSVPSMGNMPSVANMGGLNSFNSLAVPNFGNMLGGNQEPEDRIPCSCGVFLNGQFRRGSNEPPRGNAALLQELVEPFACNAVGEKQCTNKCLETIMRHLPNSPIMVCGSIDRDCHKERAYLFVKNCKDRWINTNLSAGREYCCKDGTPYKCPPS